MFAVTRRLLLRPGWIEDAAELVTVIADQRIFRNLTGSAWPCELGRAEKFLSEQRDPYFPFFMIIDRTRNPVRLIGMIDFRRRDAAPELEFWITPDRQNRGFATEAVRAAMRAVRASLGYTRIVAGHFADDPVSAHVLEKLGFRRSARREMRASDGRSGLSDWLVFEQFPDSVPTSLRMCPRAGDVSTFYKTGPGGGYRSKPHRHLLPARTAVKKVAL